MEAFNEIHAKVQKIVVLNNKIRNDLKWHLNKFSSTQSELDKWNKKMKNLFQVIKPLVVFVLLHLLIWMITHLCKDEFEKFKKDLYEERMKLKTELSYLKDHFREMNKGKSYLSHLLSVQKHTTDKTDLRYNKQADLSKKNKFATSKKVNPNKVSKKKNIIHPKPKAKTFIIA